MDHAFYVRRVDVTAKIALNCELKQPHTVDFSRKANWKYLLAAKWNAKTRNSRFASEFFSLSLFLGSIYVPLARRHNDGTITEWDIFRSFELELSFWILFLSMKTLTAESHTLENEMRATRETGYDTRLQSVNVAFSRLSLSLLQVQLSVNTEWNSEWLH